MPALRALAVLFAVARTSRAQDSGWAGQEPPDTEAVEELLRLGPYALHGSLEAGLRLVDVDGDEGQYEEGVNLDEGAFVSSFSLRGEDEGTARSFALEGAGLGDPFAALHLRAHGGPWTTLGHYERSQYVGQQDADIHGFDLERRSAGLSFGYEPGPEKSGALLALDYLEREGTWNGSRSVGHEFVAPFPELRREQALAARTELVADLDELRLELELGFEDRESRDRSSFSLPSGIFPGATWGEDYHSQVDGSSSSAALRLERELDGGEGEVDVGLAWHGTDVLGDMDLDESGFLFDPSLPFLRTTDGDLELEAEELGLDLGWRSELTADTELELRFRHEHESEDGENTKIQITDELMGAPPSVYVQLDTLEEESRLELLEAELTQALGERAELDVHLELGREDLDIREVVDGVTTRSFDDTVDEFGAEGALSLEVAQDLRVELGGGSLRRPTATTPTGVGYDFENERSSFGSAGCRWQAARGVVLSSEARLEHKDSQAFDSEGDVRRLACSIDAARERWSGNVSFVYESHELVTDVFFLVFGPAGFVQVPGQVDFEGIARTLSASLSCELAEQLRPSLSFNGTMASGDDPFDMLLVRLDVPWEFREAFVLGLRTYLQDFDGEQELDEHDYDAELLEFYLRVGF